MRVVHGPHFLKPITLAAHVKVIIKHRVGVAVTHLLRTHRPVTAYDRLM